MAAGFVASTITTIVLNPIDVAKTRLQTETSKHNNVFKVMMEIHRSEGMAAYTRGIMPKVLLIAPFSAISSVVYEIMMQVSAKDPNN